MARISRALKRIKQELQELIPASVLEEICRDLKYPYRKRKLDPLTTVRNVGARPVHHAISMHTMIARYG